MKKYILTAVLAIATLFASAQKFGYVDTEYILNNIPEYKIAQEQLDELSVKWQKEIEEKFAAIDKMYKAYQAESVLLPEDMKRKRQDEIIAKEREAKELQKQRFGKDGDLYKKRQELVKPIQDKVYGAIEEMATSGNFAVIFDKSGSLSLIYTNPRFDKSDEVLEKLGYKPGGYSTGKQ
jgi:outer membrane protein